MIPFLNPQNIHFPNLESSTEEGIVALGGDLKPERLINAYQNGIFPWYSEGDPIIWWSPDPRFILYPNSIYISKRMRRILRQKKYKITFDKDFYSVIKNCQQLPRKNQDGTWITKEMCDAYCILHEKNYAHSIEVWHNNELVGGMYGIYLGKCYFGESMFSKVNNASKIALIYIATLFSKLNFDLIDCQVYTPHLNNLGAKYISRKEFIRIIQNSFNKSNSYHWQDFNEIELSF